MWSRHSNNLALQLHAFMLALPLAASTAAPAAGQGEPNLDRHVIVEAAGAFTDILAACSRQLAVSLVADGVPVRSKAELHYSGTLRGALDGLGAAFDLSWRAGPDGWVLLSKRFTDPRERPQLVPAELLRMAEDELRLLPQAEADPNHHAWGARLIQLWRAMTPEQKQLLANGQRIRGAQLQPDQYALLEQAISIRAYGVPQAYWQQIRDVFKRLDQSHLVAVDLSYPGRTPDGLPKRIVHVVHGVLGADQSLPVCTAAERDLAQPGPAGPEANARRPRADSVARLGILAPQGDPLQTCVTLGACVVEVGDLARELSSASGVRIEAQDSIAGRRVAIAARPGRTGSILDAMAALHEWEVRRPDPGRYVLERPAVRPRMNRKELPVTMARALPCDLRTFLGVPTALEQHRRWTAFGSSRGRLSQAQDDARKQLTGSLARRFESANDVPYGRLSDLEKEAIALLWVLNGLDKTAEVMYGDEGARIMNPATCSITFEYGEALMVDIDPDPVTKRGFGFGANVISGPLVH